MTSPVVAPRIAAAKRASGPAGSAAPASVALVTVRAVPIRSRVVQRLRALFPSWRFFEELGEVPVLQVRHGAEPYVEIVDEAREHADDDEKHSDNGSPRGHDHRVLTLNGT